MQWVRQSLHPVIQSFLVISVIQIRAVTPKAGSVKRQKGHLFCVDDDVHLVLHAVDLEVLVRLAQLPHEPAVL